MIVEVVVVVMMTGEIEEETTQVVEGYGKGAEKEGEQLPVLKYVGSEEKKFSVGSTRIPQFEIVKWVDRPGDWGAEEAAPEPAPEPVAEEKPNEDIPF